MTAIIIIIIVEQFYLLKSHNSDVIYIFWSQQNFIISEWNSKVIKYHPNFKISWFFFIPVVIAAQAAAAAATAEAEEAERLLLLEATKMSTLENLKYYTSLVLGTLCIVNVFAFLFLVPFVLDPAISTLRHR